MLPGVSRVLTRFKKHGWTLLERRTVFTRIDQYTNTRVVFVYCIYSCVCIGSDRSFRVWSLSQLYRCVQNRGSRLVVLSEQTRQNSLILNKQLFPRKICWISFPLRFTYSIFVGEVGAKQSHVFIYEKLFYPYHGKFLNTLRNSVQHPHALH